MFIEKLKINGLEFIRLGHTFTKKRLPLTRAISNAGYTQTKTALQSNRQSYALALGKNKAKA